jgi:hypothetical protein
MSFAGYKKFTKKKHFILEHQQNNRRIRGEIIL